MAQEVTNFARFYALFNKLPYQGDREEFKKQSLLYCSGETERTRRMAAETSRGTATETQRLPEADATVGYRHHRLEPGERILQQPPDSRQALCSG